MTIPKRPFTRIALLTLALTGAVACEDEPSLPHNTQVEAGLQQVLDRAVAKPGILLPGAMTYYHDARFAPWSGSAGVADLQARTPMGSRDRIRSGSILKTFLAVVTLQHVEEGRLSLDQKLPELLPSSVTDQLPNAQQITLKMLLGHTSGVAEWITDDIDAAVVRDPQHIWTDQEAIALAAKHPPSFPPGMGYSYSNTNYTLVGLVLDRAAGVPWRDQVRTRVLARLGLADTSLPAPGDRSTPAPFARGYHLVDGQPVDLTEVDPSMAGAPGGNAMITTVQDLGRFLDALLAGRLFARPQTLATMTTMIETPGDGGFPLFYGLGISRYDIDGVKVIGHGGEAAGYATMMFHVPSTGATLVTSINHSDLLTNALETLLPSLAVVTAAK